MDPLFATLIVIIVALLGARVSFSTERVPLGPRLLFRTGTHFLVIGFVLGPAVLGVLSLDATRQLFPFLALGLGWVGFHFGLQLDRAGLKRFPWRHHALAFGQAVLAFGIFLVGSLVVMELAGIRDEVPLLLLLGAACTAAVTTPAGIAMVSSNFLVRGQVRDLLLFISSLDAVVGILALQVTYSLYRPAGIPTALGPMPQLALVGVAAGLGLLCGIAFLWLSRVRHAGEELVLFVLGICAFSAGAALLWGLSPLFVSVTMGAVVANFDRHRARVVRLLERWEKPVYITFLLLAGALIHLPTWWIAPLALGYAGLRLVSKTVAVGALVTILRLELPVPRRLGIGLIPQGGISLAMAVSGVLVYSDIRVRGMDAAATLFSVIVLGVMVSELIGPALTTKLLRRAGEISPKVEAALAVGDTAGAAREARLFSAARSASTRESSVDS